MDKTKVGDANFFRPWGWSSIIVVEEVKSAFERAPVKGVKFIEV